MFKRGDPGAWIANPVVTEVVVQRPTAGQIQRMKEESWAFDVLVRELERVRGTDEAAHAKVRANRLLARAGYTVRIGLG